MSKNLENIQHILINLPKGPGVYQMKDISGKVMYVGKAKNLKSRVSSYFVKTNDLSLAKRQMVAKIIDIEIITCQTEVEALVLETNIIKHLTPKYNILMKDDKNLAYLKITNSPVPELIKTRQKIRDGGVYFGPYVSGVEQSVRALRRIFNIRNCRVKFSQKKSINSLPSLNTKDLLRDGVDTSYYQNNILITDKAGKTIPCIDYYIGLCPAPCMLEKSKLEQHSQNIENVRGFLSGDAVAVFDKLEYEMREKAKVFDFEEAQKIKETLIALRGLHERQKVRDIVDGDIDICIQYEKYDKTYIALTQVRGSQVVGVYRHEIQSGIEEGEDVMIAFLMRQYVVNIDGDIPNILLCQRDFTDTAFVIFLKSQKIQLEIPKIGPKKDLLDFTQNQLREYAYKRELATLENKILTREHMSNILERLGYAVPQKGEIIFECYDISHTDGRFTYASRVVIVNGRPDPSRYRKYKIKSLEDGMIDDYASHREVMMRRTLEGIEQDNLPHLIIIDGGKGQLSSAISGINEGIYRNKSEKIKVKNSNVGKPIDPLSRSIISSSISENTEYGLLSNGAGQVQDSQGQILIEMSLPPICSIAKREEEIFLPENPIPVLFTHGTPELMVLQKARDESHRFSITANRSARSKSMKKNILEELPGIGPVTRRKLLKLAGSVDGIKDISFEQLSECCNIAQIETLRDHGFFN
ncbi:excinuclease ABC subunit UvrC [Candidatus Gracilibacteria bacterium]|nr:excinuclease ABC subunit UvrC [Candidatus Gracilibacteria bacterium]